jgi:tetrahydromethanopterin S-methyltransferase subunit G
MRKREESQAQAESKAILKRLETQSEKILGPTPEADSRNGEWTERWGKRLGLIIGYGLALYLLWHLFSNYVAQ